MKDTSSSFLGTGWAFPPAFNKDLQTVEMVSNDEDIWESIKIIIGTIPGERYMFPRFGCGIRKFVFESNDPTQITMLRDTIYLSLLYNEPRIKVESIEIKDSMSESQQDNGRLDGTIYIHISYTIIITNSRSNLVFPFYFDEGTNI